VSVGGTSVGAGDGVVVAVGMGVAVSVGGTLVAVGVGGVAVGAGCVAVGWISSCGVLVTTMTRAVGLAIVVALL
jgi:hypothetical protein